MSEAKKVVINPIMAVLCDDVRQEATGKQTIIGIYVGGITVEKTEQEKNNVVPTAVMLNLWIPIEHPDEIGIGAVEIQIVNPDPASTFKFEANPEFVAVPPVYEQSSLVFQNLVVRVDKEGDLKILFRNKGDDEWITLKSTPLKFKYVERNVAKIVSNETVPPS